MTMMARITEACRAAPTPWTGRAATSVVELSAAPQSSEASVNRATPTRNTRLRPIRIAEPAGQQQEAAERDEEGVDDPGQVALGEVEVALNRRQRDVHDRGVEHDHELARHDSRQAPAILACCQWS